MKKSQCMIQKSMEESGGEKYEMDTYKHSQDRWERRKIMKQVEH